MFARISLIDLSGCPENNDVGQKKIFILIIVGSYCYI